MSSQQNSVHWAVIPLQLVEGVLTQTLMNGQQYPSMHWSSERHFSQFPTDFFGVQSATIRGFHLYIKIFTISNVYVAEFKRNEGRNYVHTYLNLPPMPLDRALLELFFPMASNNLSALNFEVLEFTIWL